MSITTIKLLKKTITDLRARGAFDEEKYNILKRKYLVSIAILLVSVCFTFFITLAVEKIGWFIFIFMMASFFWCLFNFDLIRMTLLYTMGYKTTAKVVSGYLDNTSKGCMNTYKYRCEFLDQSNARHIVDYRNNLSVNNKEQRPSIGDKIEILYLKENPKISAKYWKQLEQKYNLKKI